MVTIKHAEMKITRYMRGTKTENALKFHDECSELREVKTELCRIRRGDANYYKTTELKGKKTNKHDVKEDIPVEKTVCCSSSDEPWMEPDMPLWRRRT